MLVVLLLATLGAGMDDGFDDVARPFLDKHCVRCHGGEEIEADLDLSLVDGTDLIADPDGWEWLLDQVEFEDMPPAGEPGPAAEERVRFVAWLRAALTAEADVVRPLVGVPLRRLTRAEYESAARSILGVSIDASRFLPEDAVAYGFDHVVEAQTLSEADFVRYLEAAEAVAERAIPIDDLGPPRVRRFAPPEMVGGHARGDARVLATTGIAGPRAPFPRAGVYVVRAETYGQQAGPDLCRARLVLGDPSNGGSESEVFEVAASRDDDGVVLEARLEVDRSGDHLAGVRFLNDYYVPRKGDTPGEDRNFAVRWIEIIGPVDASRPTDLSLDIGVRVEASGERDVTLRVIVRELAALIWRTSTVDADDIDRLLSLSESTEDAEARVRSALVGLLVSPRFLFKLEIGAGVGRDAEPDARGSIALDASEVATRLASFLWNAVPDAGLLARAEQGALGDPAGVRAVAVAMLEDPRANDFVVNFGEQWLQLRTLPGKRADRKAYPAFSTSLRASMREETRRVLIDSLRRRRDLWDLIDGDETIIDDRLARLYGVGDDDVLEPAGDGWRRVSLASTERRGLLGHASVLFATSESTRTSPVRRGKFVLEVLLDSAPPPPPPSAGDLPEPEPDTEMLSVRERFERHRSDPTCASCHVRMDPIGFGLEAYDGIGALRDPGDPLRGDISGVLPDGRQFEGPVELAAILRGEERFLETFVERLFVYALGRGSGPADRRTLANAVAVLGRETPTFELAILEIVVSDEFLRLPASAASSHK